MFRVRVNKLSRSGKIINGFVLVHHMDLVQLLIFVIVHNLCYSTKELENKEWPDMAHCFSTSVFHDWKEGRKVYR